MQARVTTKPETEVIAAIQALDLETVKMRVMDPVLGKGWTREYADRIETAYKTYLSMVAKYQDHAEDILLAKDVDEFWHTHILQTMKYADDCEHVFGGFLHHSPHVGKLTQEDIERRNAQAAKTALLYQREFGGEPDSVTAWAGMSAVQPSGIEQRVAAMSSMAIRGDQAAMSSAAIRADRAAMSSVAIRAEHAAMSSMAIRPEHAAMSSAAIRADHAAMSSVAIRAEHAAMSSIAIRPEHAAMSSLAIQR